MAGATRVGWGADGKASIERLCLSPYVEKPFNSKMIKSFVPELRSRKCFCVSGFLCCMYMYICYEHSMYVSNISVSGYGTILYCTWFNTLPHSVLLTTNTLIIYIYIYIFKCKRHNLQR